MNQLLSGLFEWFVTKPWQLLTEVVDWVKTTITETIPSALWSIIPDGLADHFDSIDFQIVQSLLDIAAWWIPFWELLTIYIAAYTLSATVRLIRHIIGWVPTIEG